MKSVAVFCSFSSSVPRASFHVTEEREKEKEREGMREREREREREETR